MPLRLDDIKKLHGKAYNANPETRELSSDDTIFYWVTHHGGDDFASTIDDGYRGEFDLLRKGGRAILGDLASNPIQNDFEPRDETREDAADLADGLYRAGSNHNTSIEAFGNATQESVVCGFGAWELRTEYESDAVGNNKQAIRRWPIFDANNTAFCDPNARLLDKSDSNFWSILTPYAEDGYIELVKELTGEEPESVETSSFDDPNRSYGFLWYGNETKKIYIVSFYHREKVKVNLITFQTFDGEIVTYAEPDVKDHLESMLDDGFEIIDEKIVDRWEVRKYIASGKEILNGEMVDGERVGEVIPGPNIPIIPRYGEHTYVEGAEYWEGMVRLAKDPVRLHDAAMQYMADIFARGAGQKPVLTRGQLEGNEEIWERAGFGDFSTYKVINDITEQGKPVSPVIGMTPDTPVPQAAQALLAETRQAVTDVVDPGNPGDIADLDLSGKAVLALQQRLDLQSVVYQEHGKHAHRRDGEVWAGMASIVYDVPETRKIELPNGTRKTVKMMEQRLNPKTGEFEVLNDLSNLEFDVYSRIGSSYSSQKDATLDRLEKLMTGLNPADPDYQILKLKYLQLMDGVDFDDVRDYSNKRLILMGVNEPETDEEKQWVAEQQQQAQQPSAEMVLAQGELAKGQAAQMDAETKRMTAQGDFTNDQAKTLIDQFKAITDRFEAQVKAQEAGAKIDKTKAEELGQQIENRTKIVELQRPKEQSDEELWQILAR